MQMLRVKKSTILLIILLCNLLTSCTSLTGQDAFIPKQTQTVIQRAEKQGFIPKHINTSLLTYAMWQKQTDDSDEIHVYIEGDGNSWRSRYELSDNPTPKNPLALKLAMQDPHSNVIYIARPCQYYFDHQRCQSTYWSDKRYSKEVVQSIEEILDQLARSRPNRQFLLIGFSGGGNIAALISSQRQDVSGLITVAGNLDHDKLNHYHQVTPLRGSLNAMHYVNQLRKVPQRHYVGSQDKIVPPWLIVQAGQSMNSACVSTRVIKRNTHHKGWVESWPDYINEALPCQSLPNTSIS